LRRLALHQAVLTTDGVSETPVLHSVPPVRPCSSMSIAIASPVASVYSETFIRMQMERLPCRLRIHGGPVASETVPGGPIAPLKSLRGVVDVILEVGPQGSRWDGPQRRELKRRLSRANVQAVLANYGHVGVALLPVCMDLGIPLIVHFHGYDAHMADVVAKYRESYRKLGASASAVVAVSRVMVNALEGVGIPAETIHLVRYGCDPVVFQEKTACPDVPTFFGVGRFVDKKAPYLTLLAFKRVHDERADARLVLAGDGVLFESTRNMAQSLGLGSAVEFVGVLTPEQVAQQMRASTAFVQHSIVPAYGPSRGDSEGTPVAVLEAMLTGLPIVATRHAGIGEVVEHGSTGLLVEERDTDGMAQAMLRLAGDAGLARTMGRQARKEALSHYTADHYVGALNRVIGLVDRHQS
jgi:colanic acid/amylovoran biosynthesis glycosyltransferase